MHPVGAICNHNLGVFTVTKIAMENVCPATLRGRRPSEILRAPFERGFSRVAFLAPSLRSDFVSPPSYGLTIRCWADREIRRSAGCFHFCHARPRSVEFAIWAMAVRGIVLGSSRPAVRNYDYETARHTRC
jgi:hypothetical protein